MHNATNYPTLPRYQTLDPNAMSGNLGANQYELMPLHGNQITSGNTPTYVASPDMRIDISPQTAEPTSRQLRGITIARRIIGGAMIAGGVAMVGYGIKLMLTKENDPTKNNSTTSSKTAGGGLIAGGVILASLGGLIISPSGCTACCAYSAEACCYSGAACCYVCLG